MNSRRKGQVEFIVIVALVVIGVVVFIFASRQSVIPTAPASGIPEEAKTIKDAIVNLMRAGVKEKMALIYNQGGTLTPSSLSAKFGAFNTEVWSACGQNNIPDVSKEIGAGILAYLRENLKDEMDFSGKTAKFDFSKPRYEVDVIKDAVNIRVYLPTKVESYDIQQPYEISISSKLYDVVDFSKNFVSDNSKSRFFEVVTLTSMVHSNPDNEAWVPVAGLQSGCGNPLMKTRKQLLPGIKGIIKYTISHIVWNTPTLKLAENPFYPVNSVGGKYYPGLQVAFAYPPSWDSEIDKYFAFSPDPLRIIPKPIVPLIPFCMAPYAVSYSFRYPAIVMVEDKTLNQWFKFAVMVDIQNTQPGNCTAEFGKESEYSKVCVNDAKCDAKITVKNTTGSPVEGASVGFYTCDVGTTDSNGVVEGKIPCMISELHVYDKGHRSYGDLFRSDELKDKTVTVESVEEKVAVHFMAIYTSAKTPATQIAQGGYAYNDYSLGATSEVMDLGNSLDKNFTVFLTMSPENPNYFTGEDSALVVMNYNDSNELASAINISGIQPITYTVTASIADTTDEESSKPLGYINVTGFKIGEGATDIYVYIPTVLDVNGISSLPDEGIDPSEANKLTAKAYNKCGGLPPVSTTELSC
jgi:hypothetical protein